MVVGSGPALAMARREARSTIWLVRICILCLMINGIMIIRWMWCANEDAWWMWSLLRLKVCNMGA